jgi:hypothetical protein
LALPTMTLVLRGSVATAGSFSRPHDREHSVITASLDPNPVTIV